jgi:hypothetical protein
MKQGLKTLWVRASTVYRGPILKGKISGRHEAGGNLIQGNGYFHCAVNKPFSANKIIYLAFYRVEQ